MKHASTNALNAMELIGICGHDDTHFEPMTNARGDQSFPCPMRGMTLFYTAQALGSDADVDANFKAKLASVQAPSLGASALPSKSYHVLGGALFSCLMKAQGLPDEEIRAVNSLLARVYRGLDMRNRVLLYGNLSTTDSSALDAELRANCRTLSGRFLCPDFKGPSGYDQAREDRWVAGKLAEFDSYFLISRWKKIKTVPIVGWPVDLDLDITAPEAADRPPGWSTERFDRALQRLRTYAADRAWIDRQHRAGSDFGRSRCAGRPVQ